MGVMAKAKARLKSRPKDYTYGEAKQLLERLGYQEYTKGKTSGSRVQFYRASDQDSILLHKPHPGDEMKHYAVKQLADHLEARGDI